MHHNTIIKKKLASNWFALLSDVIYLEIEKIENEYNKKKNKKYKHFETKEWKKSHFKSEGGGKFRILRNGNLFEKVGVNFSEVSGKFDKKFKSQVPGTKKNSNYWASGISIVMHMKNPHIPAFHFNTRFISTSENWFGGGMDMTPCLKDKVDEKFFHNKIKKMCNKHNKSYYSKYKKLCDNYFFLKHRNEMRGVGGIFFDYKKNNWEKDFNFVIDVGLCFLDCITSIIRKKMLKGWNKKQKNIQLFKRGRYAEFNLIYDRGTKFGLSTGGNTEAILMSLPPTVKWS